MKNTFTSLLLWRVALTHKELAETKDTAKGYYLLIGVAIILVAINLRPAITSVGPLIGTIRDDIGFANWNVALLTSLPLIAFMLISPIAPRIAQRLTTERTLMLGLFILAIGISMRSISLIVFLFLGTFLIGSGIAICNVLLPSIIQDKFPQKVALMTSLYTTFMTLFATVASGVSIPLADGLNLGWQQTLLFWIIPAFVGLVIWFIVVKKLNIKRTVTAVSETEERSNKRIWKEPLAWSVTLFMGFQSFMFYVMLSWLPEIVQFYGMGKSGAGFMLAYFQLLGIPASFMMPMLAMKMRNQRLLILLVNLSFVSGLILFIVNSSFVAMVIATTLIGIGSGSNFALALTFLSIRAKNPTDVAKLSGMAQSLGYSIAAIGPIAIGFLFDITEDWTVPLYVLVTIVLMIIIFGLQAGRNRFVFDNK